MQHFYVTNFDGVDHAFEILRINPDGKSKNLFKVTEGQAWVVSPKPSPDGRFLTFQQRTFEFIVAMLENY
jgi:Tol biopolymer transport system component